MNWNQESPQLVKELDRRHNDFRKVYLRWVAVLILACFWAFGAAVVNYSAKGCNTDAECMRSCPMPMDDVDCDGGPKS
jgi:hypothetical protein